MSSDPDRPAGDAARGLPLPDCGQRISVESPRHDGKLWTHMIGFKPGGYLVLEKPPGADAVEGPLALKDGDSLVIRFLKDGSIYGFRTPVLSTLSFPYKLLFVAFPVDVVRHSLRSSPRLQTHLPCYGQIGGRMFSRAFIRDFSATGCQLRIPLDALEQVEEYDEDVEASDGETSAAPKGTAAAGEGGVESAPTEASAGTSAASASGTATDAGGADGDVSADDADEWQEPGPNSLTLNLHLPGEDELRIAEGQVLEWQTLERYHLLRVRFDEPQTDVFEQLCLYTTQLG
ncbi:MAG: flagellar brake protein [Gammaproteobacteria bacterium]|nr:flagellar brake protein [Gammaproteobacteria bacterium]